MNDFPKTRSMNEILILLVIGLAAGFLSGMAGVGGGIIIVPALVYFLGFNQHSAQGTTLFMFLFPIGLLGVMHYYKTDHVDWRAGLIMCSTFIVGIYFSSKLAVSIDQATIKKIFGALIIIMGVKMLFWK